MTITPALPLLRVSRALSTRRDIVGCVRGLNTIARRTSSSQQAAEHRLSITDPESYWMRASKKVHWTTPPTHAMDRAAEPTSQHFRWFKGAVLNTCYNAVDVHVEAGRGSQIAIINESTVTGTTRTMTYAQLQDATARVAGLLTSLGVHKGDRVLIYMPMVMEAAVAMLACARIGAVHSVVFGGFAPPELAARINDCKPKVVLSASCGLEPNRIVRYKPLLDEAIRIASHHPHHCVVLQRDMQPATLVEGRDLDWAEAVSRARPHAPVPVDATHPLYILYTSGTTGKPKGVVRDNGGHAVALAHSMEMVYGCTKPGEVFFAGSDIGWVVGHSYIVYGPLMKGLTTVMYEGKPIWPDAGVWWRTIEKHKANVCFFAPTAIRAIKREDPLGKLAAGVSLKSVRALFLAGERSDNDTVRWAENLFKVPVVDHWWQTETGWPMAAQCLGLNPNPNIRHGSAGPPVPGYNISVIDESTRTEMEPNTTGEIVVRLPLPPGCFPTLWHNDKGHHDSYLATHPGYYQTGDAGYYDEDGNLFIMSRIDDVINVAGHRLSTSAFEEVLCSHPSVAECAVIGVSCGLKGQIPIGLVVLKVGADADAKQLETDCEKLIRASIGPVAAYKHTYIVKALPKTRSGKVLRKTMRQIANKENVVVPATIE
eukprot:Opistho-2@60341